MRPAHQRQPALVDEGLAREPRGGGGGILGAILGEDGALPSGANLVQASRREAVGKQHGVPRSDEPVRPIELSAPEMALTVEQAAAAVQSHDCRRLARTGGSQEMRREWALARQRRGNRLHGLECLSAGSPGRECDRHQHHRRGDYPQHAAASALRSRRRRPLPPP